VSYIEDLSSFYLFNPVSRSRGYFDPSRRGSIFKVLVVIDGFRVSITIIGSTIDVSTEK